MPISIRELLQTGLLTSRQLQSGTGQSQATISRELKALGEDIVRISKGRSVYYTLAVSSFGASNSIPIFQTDTNGYSQQIANLRPLANGEFCIQPVIENFPMPLLGENGNGYFSSLPYFIYDLAPQGFIGRQIARAINSKNDSFPTNPKHWSDQYIGRYLVNEGYDLPGNLTMGQPRLVDEKPFMATRSNYPEIAEDILSGGLPGSSAGGEQPKFSVYNSEIESHVIVKFSPKGNDPISQRWKQLLIAEHDSLETLRAQGLSAANTQLIEKNERIYLESVRFDRHGFQGRSSLISLQVIDMEFTGIGGNWPDVMKGLARLNLVSDEEVYVTEKLYEYGRKIGNTDMHLGNLSLKITNTGFKLLPIYDMLPMKYAPVGGELPKW